MEKIAQSMGLRRSTRSFAKINNPHHQDGITAQQVSSSRHRHQQVQQPSYLSNNRQQEYQGHHISSQQHNLQAVSISSIPGSTISGGSSKGSASGSSSKAPQQSWDRRLSLGIKRTISKLKIKSSTSKSNYIPVSELALGDSMMASPAASPTNVSVSSMPIGGQFERGPIQSQSVPTRHVGSRPGVGHQSYVPQQHQNRNYPPQQMQPHHSVSSSVKASAYLGRPRMGTGALRYSRESANRTACFDQSFNVMFPVNEDYNEQLLDNSSIGNNQTTTQIDLDEALITDEQPQTSKAGGGGFLWKGKLDRYNLRSSRSRLTGEPGPSSGALNNAMVVDENCIRYQGNNWHRSSAVNPSGSDIVQFHI